MRIRKRFPFSSMASSVSDPQLNNSTLVQQTSSQLHPIQNMGMQPNPNSDSQPSDPPLSSDEKPIIINNTLHRINQMEEASREQQEENGSNNNNTRKEYNFLAVGETGVVPPLGSHQVDGRWFYGDEKVPLKRKGQETMLMLEEEEEKMMKPKMKSKANKKCTSTSGMQQSHSEQGKAGNDDSSSTPNNNSVKKMNKRGGAIMEGSRCSRVNGRGWRCCQQTLVGYSLCEHHLGKGRLRSISNVKARTKAPAVVATTIAPQVDTTTNDIPTNDNLSSKNVLVLSSVVSSSVVQPPVGDRKDTMLLDGSCYDDDDEEDEDENEDEDDDDYNGEETNKAVVVKKKRMKLGMVKARSLSSLLNQTN